MVYDDDDVPDLVQGPIYDSDDEDDEVTLPTLSDDDDMRQHYHEDETPPPLRRSTRERLPRDPAYVYATISRPIRRKPLSFLRNCTIAERRTAYANNLVHFILAADTPDADMILRLMLPLHKNRWLLWKRQYQSLPYWVTQVVTPYRSFQNQSDSQRF
jgi:hypothetical protein